MLLTSHEHDGILHAAISGPVSLQEVLRLKTELLDRCAAHKLPKALVDCLAVTGKLTTFQRYEVGLKCVAQGVALGINPWVAIVGVPPTVDGFAADVANNRGARALVFAEREPALTWLTRLKTADPPASPQRPERQLLTERYAAAVRQYKQDVRDLARAAGSRELEAYQWLQERCRESKRVCAELREQLLATQ